MPPAMPSVVPAALDPQGSAARTIADLWWVMVVLGGLAAGIVAIALIVGLRRNRIVHDDQRQPDGRNDHDDHDGRDESDRRLGTDSPAPHRLVVFGGIVVPVVLVAVVLGATLTSMRSIADDGRDPSLVVEVVGHQWWWEVVYPDHGVVTANEIHVPVGTPVRLELRSADVIHSFWVPALAGKIDLLPERANTLVIDAGTPGRYEGHCAEFCGIQHANMGLAVIAHRADDFDHWLTGQRLPAETPASDLAHRGADVFVTRGCASCHTVRGMGARGDDGPDLTHFAGRQEIGAGAADNTTSTLETWITDPHAIKEGVLMPATELTDEEVDALVAFLEGLR